VLEGTTSGMATVNDASGSTREYITLYRYVHTNTILVSTLGVARCGRSAGYVLCALWAVSAAVLGRAPCGDKHIIIILTTTRESGS